MLCPVCKGYTQDYFPKGSTSYTFTCDNCNTLLEARHLDRNVYEIKPLKKVDDTQE